MDFKPSCVSMFVYKLSMSMVNRSAEGGTVRGRMMSRKCRVSLT